MHELSLMADLMRKLDAIAREQYPAKIIDVTIKLGALAHVSAQHLREHFVQAPEDRHRRRSGSDQIGTDVSNRMSRHSGSCGGADGCQVQFHLGLSGIRQRCNGKRRFAAQSRVGFRPFT
jgi:hypothetical protein